MSYAPLRLIRLSPEIEGRALVDAVIHEIIHARCDDLAEEAVAEAATVAACQLDKMGLLKL